MRNLICCGVFAASLLTGASRSAAEVDWTKYVEFRNAEDPTTVMRTAVKPWTDDEKAQVLELLRTFPDKGEGMLVRAAAFGPMRFYRVADAKANVAGRDDATVYALAHHLSYGVYFFDRFFDADLRTDPLFIRWTLFHEFAHLADIGPAGLSESAAWAKLVDDRIRRAKADVAALPTTRKEVEIREAVGRAGVPSYYATFNRSEALAEYATTHLIAQPPMSAENFQFPDDVRELLQTQFFALPYAADVSYKLTYEGRNLRERERKLDAALAKANEAIALNPRNLNAYYLRGLTYLEQKKDDEAVADLEKTLTLYETDGPYRPMLHRYLGELFSRKNDEIRAIEHFRLAAVSREPEAFRLLSAALVKAKQFDEAIEVLDKLVAQTPATAKYDRARALLARAGAKLDKSDAAAAQVDLEAVTALDPSDPVLFSGRGHFWKARGNHEQFEADFAKAIELAPQDMSLYKTRAAARQERGAHREAIADYDVLLAANKMDLSALVARGKSRIALGEYDQAAADAEAVLKVFPRPLDAAVQLRADARIAAGRREQCLAELDALIEKYPTTELWKTMRADAVKRLEETSTKPTDVGKPPAANASAYSASAWREAWDQEQTFRQREAEANDLPRVKIRTTLGEIVVELFENESPNTVANFVNLVEKKFYDGLKFDRATPGDHLRSGCPVGDGTGGPGYDLAPECSKPDRRRPFRNGLTTVLHGRNSNGSQFQFLLDDAPELDGRVTVFGRIIAGADVVEKIAQQSADEAKPGIQATEVLRKRSHDYVPQTLAIPSDSPTLSGATASTPADPTVGRPSTTAGEVVTNKLGMKFRFVPAGKFWMGQSSVDTANPSQVDEKRHWVTLSNGFYLGAHEVTTGQFRQFIQATGYKTEAERGKGGTGFNVTKNSLERQPTFSFVFTGFVRNDDHPVVNVSWNDAAAFCKWLSESERTLYRLPSETEWEFACRAGTDTSFSTGDDPEQLKSYGNLADESLLDRFPSWKSTSEYNRFLQSRDGFVFTAPIGSFKPNGLGLFDMHGNVWEWCADGYGDYPAGEVVDPSPALGGKERVFRGGAWDVGSFYVRSAKRGHNTPDYVASNLGFRVAFDTKPVSTTAIAAELTPASSNAAGDFDSRFATTFGALLSRQAAADAVPTAICFGGPCRDDDLEQLAKLPDGFRIVGISLGPFVGPQAGTVPDWVDAYHKALDRANTQAGSPCQIVTDIRNCLDADIPCDAVILVGFLAAEKPALDLVPKTTDSLVMLRRTVTMCLQVGKDVYVQTSRADRIRWRPTNEPINGPIGEENPAVLEKKYARMTFLGDQGTDGYAEFLESIRTREPATRSFARLAAGTATATTAVTATQPKPANPPSKATPPRASVENKTPGDPWLRRRFMPRADAKLMVGTKEISPETLTLPYLVTKVNGDWLWIGEAWVQKSDVVPLDDAVDYYTGYIATNPSSSWAHNLRGISRKNTFFDKDARGSALADFTEAVRLNPNSAAAYYNRAMLNADFDDLDLMFWGEDEELESAVADMSAAIRINPNYAEAYLFRGLMRYQLREFKDSADEVMNDLTKAIQLGLNDLDAALAHMERGGLWFQKQRYDKAAADFGEAIRFDPDYPYYEPYHRRADAWEKLGDLDRAIADYSKIIELNDNDDLEESWALLKRGKLRLKKGEQTTATADFAEVVRIKPDYAKDKLRYATDYVNKRKYDLALELFNDAVLLAPNDAAVFNGRAWFYATCSSARHRNGKQAVADANRACELTNWTNAGYLDTLAAAYAEAGDFEQAVKWIQEAVKLAADADLRGEFEAHQRLFQQNKPYHQPE